MVGVFILYVCACTWLHALQGVASSAHIEQQYPTNLFIGTGGDGFGIGSTPPGAQLPFGMVRLSPDTAYDNLVLQWRHFGGYYYGDNEIRCFSHTHTMGAGVIDYGHVGVMPTRKISEEIVGNNGYRSTFSHKTEVALPGYYSVMLDSHDVHAEMTVAGVNTGMHRYSFRNSAQKYLIFDPSHSVQKGAIANASISITSKPNGTVISGWSLLKGSLTGRNGVGVKVYFVAKVLQQVSGHGTWLSTTLHQNSDSTTGPVCGAFLEISSTESSNVTVVVSLSMISVEQAKANLAHDWNGEDFETILRRSTDIWSKTLGQVQVTMQDDDSMKKFYTSLYHVFSAPTEFTEAGYYYLGVDNEVHKMTKFRYFSDLSLWDIHRTQAPLLTLLQPDVSSGIVESLLRMYEQGGALPRWPIANVYGGSMIGNHGYQVILENILKGALNQTDVNITEVYVAMLDEANRTNIPHDARSCLKEYIHYGYCPMESEGDSVSRTLAYSYDDWVVATLAQMLNRTNVAEVFFNRSRNYKNVWDNERQLMCPRDKSGKFHCPLDAALHEWIVKSTGYTEGDAEEWRWFVPHDIPGLINLFKSPESFTEELDKFFEKSRDHPSNFLPNPYYWAGNEPDLLAVYLFNYNKRPDLTQKHVRWLMDNKYTSTPDGLPGNDDYGTLSAWYVWSALGLYPLSGTTKYFVGSPAVHKATVQLPSGNSLVITALNNTVDNIYVKNVTLNNKPLNMQYPFIGHSEITNGATITFSMSSEP